jgi:SAM-dependent methyltransferase
MNNRQFCSTPEQFPRSRKYDRDFPRETASSGSNAFWLIEWLSEALPLRKKMRILDLGCGDARSSLFLAKEFGVEVWAVDLHRSPGSTFSMLKGYGLTDSVFPLACDARHLPFAPGFFDGIVCVDAYYYFGSDDFYAMYVARFLKRGGFLGLVGGGLHLEWSGRDDIPEHLKDWWIPDHWGMHSGPWWSDHIRKSECYRVNVSDRMPDGWRHWFQWQSWAYPHNSKEISALERDAGRNLGYWRVVADRNERNPAYTSWHPYSP